MKLSALYRLLESPIIYSLTQKLLSPEANFLLRKKVNHLAGKSKGLVLDIGCGPRPALSLPDGRIVGADENSRYIKRYLQYTGDKRSFGVVCSATSLPFLNSVFDECRCTGLLHHLDKKYILLALKEILRCTRKNGRIIVFDRVWPDAALRRPLAWFFCRLDRGGNVLTEDELLGLVHTTSPQGWSHRRFTYTFSGCEGLILMFQKTA